MTVISEQQLCENIDDVMREVEDGKTFEVSVSGRIVAKIVPAAPDGPQEVVDPVVIRRIGSMSPAASAAWKKDIAAATEEDGDDERTEG